MKIDCQEIRRVVRRTQREGVSTVETPLAAELMRQMELTDKEVDALWELLEDDSSPPGAPGSSSKHERRPPQPHPGKRGGRQSGGAYPCLTESPCSE